MNQNSRKIIFGECDLRLSSGPDGRTRNEDHERGGPPVEVMFTLDGILRDLGASAASEGVPIARQLALHWLTDRKAFRSPLRVKDWITLQCSALLYTSRLWMRCEQGILDRLLPRSSSASA